MKNRLLNIEIKNQRHVHIVQERFSYQSLRYWILYVCEQCIFISIFEEKKTKPKVVSYEFSKGIDILNWTYPM